MKSSGAAEGMQGRGGVAGVLAFANDVMVVVCYCSHGGRVCSEELGIFEGDALC